MRYLSAAVTVALLSAGCANPINLRTASHYANACQAFEAQNEWWKARMNCGRAAINADLGHAPDKSRALLWYEYGRASGAICDYAEAKRGLETALDLDEKAGGPYFMSLLELARLHLDQGKAKEAAAYFARFEKAVPEESGAKVDPSGYADILEEYARASEASGDASLAGTLRQRSTRLRTANPNKTSNTDRTPYGKYCDQKS